MIRYVAFLRGIGPTNPNMHNDKLRGVLEKIGFNKVQSVISSGNVLFEAVSQDTKSLEEKIEKAWPSLLGFRSTTIVRSKEELEKLALENPFGAQEHSQRTSLNVTFLKNKVKVDMKFPYKVENRAYTILGMYDGAICSVIDLTSAKTPDLMLWLEKQFGREITTRTWRTVNMILKKMES